MIIEIGHFALILATIVAAAQTVVPAWGAQTRDAHLIRFAEPAAVTQVILIAISFAALTYAFVVSDFSVLNVINNSHSTKPLIYRISGVWGNHEGSMLLWVLILAVFGAAVALYGNNLPATLKANVLSVQASIALAFLLFILLTSNPFERITPPPADGRGLNPILQDPALAFHPPFLYMGYVGFSMAFSFAVAALIEGRTDAAWARWVRPWTLLAWMCLTIGIAMGSWWAYYELGWGGWWFWDPVENASFMPWLAGTALLHSALVMEKRAALKIWTILLAILTFSLSLMGTFLVRSGVLSSVHAFAVDPDRGTFVLAILVLFTGGALTLFAWRAQSMSQGGIFAPISREGSLVLNNVLLTVACGTVLIGTLYPLVTEAFGYKLSVGAPYFNATFVPLMIPLLLALPFGPFLAWKRGDVRAAAQRLFVSVVLAAAAFVIAFIIAYRGPWLAPVCIAIAVWIMAGAINEIAFRAKLGQVPFSDAVRRMRNLPRAAFGTMCAHFGVGLMVLGIVGTSAYKSEAILLMKPNQVHEIAGYKLTFKGADPTSGPNYQELIGTFNVHRDGELITTLHPSKRIYNQPPQPTTEAGIHASWRGDLYAILGDQQPDGGYAIRLYFHPMVRFIWLGTLIMFVGGAISLADRRLRIGAPIRARTSAPDASPAE